MQHYTTQHGESSRKEGDPADVPVRDVVDDGRLGVIMSVSVFFFFPWGYPSICPPGRNDRTAHMVLFIHEGEGPEMYTPPLKSARSLALACARFLFFFYTAHNERKSCASEWRKKRDCEGGRCEEESSIALLCSFWRDYFNSLSYQLSADWRIVFIYIYLYII